MVQNQASERKDGISIFAGRFQGRLKQVEIVSSFFEIGSVIAVGKRIKMLATIIYKNVGTMFHRKPKYKD